jgi:hypothetical protein
MSGLDCATPGPEVMAELRRGAVLGLLRLEIEAMLLRLEVESMRRKPQIELFEADDAEDAWIVRVDPGVWGSGQVDAPPPRRRVFRLTGGKAALKLRAKAPCDPETMLALARELVGKLEAELGVASQTQDAA